MGILTKVKAFFSKTVSAPVETISKSLGVVAVVALPAISHAEDAAAWMTPDELKAQISSIGMPTLIGAAVVGMLTIAVLMWGGKRLIGFFSK